MTIYVVMRHLPGREAVPVRAANSMSVATMHAIDLDNEATSHGSEAVHVVVPVTLETGDIHGHS